MFNYPVTLTKDGNQFLVTFKDVPEAITFGKTKEQAFEKAIEALETGLSFYIESRKPLPKPSKSLKAVHNSDNSVVFLYLIPSTSKGLLAKLLSSAFSPVPA
jgi:predicted RNase H-like HicB family nuclease